MNGSISPKPLIKLSKKSSCKPVNVIIKSALPADIIRYTLDGSEPMEKSLVYTSELQLTRTCVIQAKAFSINHLPSYVSSDTFHLKFAKKLHLLYPNSPKYTGNNKNALADGKFASPFDFTFRWLGFEQVDMVAEMKLCKNRDIKSVTLRFLNDQNSWIFLPVYISVEVSQDGKNFTKVYEKNTFAESNTESDVCEVKEFYAELNCKSVRYIRISAKNMGACPAWHKGSGNNCWLFSDEIIVE